MTDLTPAFAFQTLKVAIIDVVANEPRGIRQSAVAKALGIPAKFDNNWITKSMLDGLVKEEILLKDENKLFTINTHE